MSNNPQMSENFTNSNTYNFLNFDTNESVINQLSRPYHTFIN